MKPKAFFNWSGGKDSAFALYKTLNENIYSVEYLLTTVSAKYHRISMHGVREELLDKQTQSIGIPLQKVFLPDVASMEVYENAINDQMVEFQKKGINHAIFGDIFLEDLKQYRIEQLKRINMQAVFPVWKIDTMDMVLDFIAKGFKAIVVSIDARYLDNSFAGAQLDKHFLNNLPKNVDPCGENGEFHSFVYDGPIFKSPVTFTIGEKVYKEYEHNTDANKSETTNGYWYCDLV